MMKICPLSSSFDIEGNEGEMKINKMRHNKRQQNFRLFSPPTYAKPYVTLLYYSLTYSIHRFLPGFAPFVDGTVMVNPASLSIAPLKIPMGSAIAG
jgi:hypothetical protein